MDRIWTVTVVRNADSFTPRCWGWFRSLEQAVDAVMTEPTWLLFEEGYYQYVVIEDYAPGICTHPTGEWWAQYTHETKTVVPIPKPLWSEKVVNWGIG